MHTLSLHDALPISIGQRRGIKVSGAEPLYVIEINSEKNEIIVGKKKELIKKKINLKNINVLCQEKELEDKIFVKVRSTGKFLKANVNISNNYAEVNLLEPEYGISPGQACVFYSIDNDNKVLGGGWINK